MIASSFEQEATGDDYSSKASTVRDEKAQSPVKSPVKRSEPPIKIDEDDD